MLCCGSGPSRITTAAALAKMQGRAWLSSPSGPLLAERRDRKVVGPALPNNLLLCMARGRQAGVLPNACKGRPMCKGANIPIVEDEALIALDLADAV